MLLNLLGAALISFGVFIIFLVIEGKEVTDEIAMGILLAGIGLMYVGWKLLTLPVEMDFFLKKTVGLITAAVGFFFAFGFPSTMSYQGKYHLGMVHAAVLFGLTFLVFGAWLLLFG